MGTDVKNDYGTLPTWTGYRSGTFEEILFKTINLIRKSGSYQRWAKNKIKKEVDKINNQLLWYDYRIENGYLVRKQAYRKAYLKWKAKQPVAL